MYNSFAADQINYDQNYSQQQFAQQPAQFTQQPEQPFVQQTPVSQLATDFAQFNGTDQSADQFTQLATDFAQQPAQFTQQPEQPAQFTQQPEQPAQFTQQPEQPAQTNIEPATWANVYDEIYSNPLPSDTANPLVDTSTKAHSTEQIAPIYAKKPAILSFLKLVIKLALVACLIAILAFMVITVMPNFIPGFKRPDFWYTVQSILPFLS